MADLDDRAFSLIREVIETHQFKNNRYEFALIAKDLREKIGLIGTRNRIKKSIERMKLEDSKFAHFLVSIKPCFC